MSAVRNRSSGNSGKMGQSGFRSKGKGKGSVAEERKSASARVGGRPGSNSGRSWDEQEDYRLGDRTSSALPMVVDTKDTQQQNFSINAERFRAARRRNQSLGYDYSLQVEFLDAFNEGIVELDITIIDTRLFDELRTFYEKHHTEKKSKTRKQDRPSSK